MRNRGAAAGLAIAIIVVVIVVAGVGAFLLLRGEGGGGPDITGKKVLMIIAPTDFNDTEYTTTRNVLTQSGATVSVASMTTQTAMGMQGTQVTPDLTINDVNVANYDAVVFIGGAGAETYFNNTQAHLIATTAYSQGKKIGAICIAPVILANAGVLDGKRATVFDGTYATMLEGGGATYTGESVTVDGNIVTANGPGASSEFAQRIVAALGS